MFIKKLFWYSEKGLNVLIFWQLRLSINRKAYFNLGQFGQKATTLKPINFV